MQFFTAIALLAVSALALAAPEAAPQAGHCPSACPGGNRIGSAECRLGACPGQEGPCDLRACPGGRREVCGKEGQNCVVL
ncbi:hypothetical protein B0J14DRAFT_670948 [Halenospora varia]|nr:hypothetical protein B0J14DRAFT_670948 [Halenospora varia]